MVEVALGARALVLIAALAAFDAPREIEASGGRTTLVAGVADAQTGAAIEGAEVLIPDLHLSARSNGLGEAQIRDIPAGRYVVRVRFLGYAMSEVSLLIQGDTTGAVFRLERVPAALATVNVKGRAVPIRLKDFEIRRHQAFGRFLVAEELDKVALQDFPLLVSTKFPGLRSFGDVDGHWHIASTRTYLNVQTGMSPCDVQVYLDDVALHASEGDLDFLRTADFAGVEYYTAPVVPVRYRTKAYGCGVMLLWSKWEP
jgi:hypothetical protein